SRYSSSVHKYQGVNRIEIIHPIGGATQIVAICFSMSWLREMISRSHLAENLCLGFHRIIALTGSQDRHERHPACSCSEYSPTKRFDASSSATAGTQSEAMIQCL